MLNDGLAEIGLARALLASHRCQLPRLLAGLEAAQGGNPDGFAKALNLKKRRGPPLHLLEAKRRRNEALRDIALRFFAGVQERHRTVAMVAAIKAYAGRGWIVDRAARSVPDQHLGTLRYSLFLAFSATDGVMPAMKELRVLAKW